MFRVSSGRKSVGCGVLDNIYLRHWHASSYGQIFDYTVQARLFFFSNLFGAVHGERHLSGRKILDKCVHASDNERQVKEARRAINCTEQPTKQADDYQKQGNDYPSFAFIARYLTVHSSLIIPTYRW